MTEEQRQHLALALVPGLGPKLTAALLAHFGSPRAVLNATVGQLREVPLIGEKLAASFASSFRTVSTHPEEQLLAKHMVQIAVLGSAGYPARLASITDPPGLLYLRGSITAADSNAIGIVGSRACTSYGKRMAAKLAAGLARAGWTVISGLARGIDGAAHEGALEAGGRTLAVLAGGLSRIYPPEHTALAERVVSQGCCLSETPMTMEPQPGMFPARNRIISALSRAVVVVEANIRSGALITVTHAAEQGREVFAVPGPVDSPASAGCLELLRKGARMIRDADDLLEDLRGIVPPDPPAAPVTSKRRQPAPGPTLFAVNDEPAPTPPPPEPAIPLEGVSKQIWDALDEPRHTDEIGRLVGLPVADLAKPLMQLQLNRRIRRLPGNRYERLR